MTNPIPPDNNQSHEIKSEIADLQGKGGGVGTPSGFQKMFPNATPEELKQIVGNFLNQMMQQIKQENEQMLESLKKLGQDSDDD